MTETDTLYSSLGEAKRYAKDLEAKLAERQWQPIETAPRDGSMIMIWCPSMAGERMPRIVKWSDEGGFPWVDPDGGNGAISARQPTHWMPLPPPPSA